jgi:hypothetical protein
MTRSVIDKFSNNIFTSSASAPSSPAAGDVWYDTTNSVYKHYSGTEWLQMSNVVLDGSTADKAPKYGSEIVALGSFSAGLYYLAPTGHSAQQVYVDSDGFMLFYRHAGTGGSYNSTYEITGDALGEAAVGTLTSPTMGLTTTGVSTTAGSRGLARLATNFVRALGGNTDQNIIKMDVGGQIVYITDAQWYATAGISGADIYGHDSSISYGSSAANPRSQRTNYNTGETSRPLGTYPGNSPNIIPYYHASGYSGGYNGTWNVSCTMWVRQY